MISKIIICIRRFRKHIVSAYRGRGMKNAFKKTIQIYRRDGWQGVKNMLYFVVHAGILPKVVAEDGQAVHRNNYSAWIRRYDLLKDGKRKKMYKKIGTFKYKPMISLLMPVYNPNSLWLKQAIDSVQSQVYQNWELCIADDASTNDDVVPMLKKYAKEDKRIKVFFRKENGHISASSNSALKITTGEYIALIDQDDLLSEHALFWVVDIINSNPGIQLIYSDEDKIDKNGNRVEPYFKCELNTDLLYSHNMICHLGVYKKELVQKVGGFREGFEGAQDYDLALRCLENIEAREVAHIPRVLYHWRQHEESTSSASEAKPYALKSGQKALNEHFKRTGIKANVEVLDFGMYRTRYSLPDKLPLVSIIIPTRNGYSLIKQCINSIILKTTYSNYEIIVVDNNSDDACILRYFKELEEDRRVSVVRDKRPFNYSILNNYAVKMARGEFVCLMNNDIEVISKEWLSEMVSIALQPRVGAIGARLWYPNQTLQHGGIITGLGGIAGHSHKHLRRGLPGYFCRAKLIQGMSAVTGACLLVKKSIYEDVGGLNETDLKVALNDVDFCLRVRDAGYRNIWTPYAELYHHESATRGYEDEDPEKQARFMKEKEYLRKRWGESLLNDPAYTPNLTLDYEDFSFAWPPRVDPL